ncbi:hypothetical protein NKJ28_00355 [Mesorhizobium sp. M0145]|uniref:hypothetical protein n=1 Tax=Mesorhizobium sp. M0145 TaxID=2956895 RepID=UPI003335A273
MKMTIRLGEDWQGNRNTNATYVDSDGHPRSTRINGWVPEHVVQASLAAHRRGIALNQEGVTS